MLAFGTAHTVPLPGSALLQARLSSGLRRHRKPMSAGQACAHESCAKMRTCWWLRRRPLARSCAQRCRAGRPGTPRRTAPPASRTPQPQRSGQTRQRAGRGWQGQRTRGAGGMRMQQRQWAASPATCGNQVAQQRVQAKRAYLRRRLAAAARHRERVDVGPHLQADRKGSNGQQ